MFVRIVTFTGAKNIEGGLDYLRTTAAPALRQRKGWRGTTASVDRADAALSVVSLWESAADCDPSGSAMSTARTEAQDVIGGTLSVDYFEQVVFDVAKPPTRGARLLVRPISMDPAKIDENTEFFTSQVLPQIKAQSGYLVLRSLINRETGEGAVGSVYVDEASLEAAAATAEGQRSLGEQRGITFGEFSKREVAFVDLA